MDHNVLVHFLQSECMLGTIDGGNFRCDHAAHRCENGHYVKAVLVVDGFVLGKLREKAGIKVHGAVGVGLKYMGKWGGGIEVHGDVGGGRHLALRKTKTAKDNRKRTFAVHLGIAQGIAKRLPMVGVRGQEDRFISFASGSCVK